MNKKAQGFIGFVFVFFLAGVYFLGAASTVGTYMTEQVNGGNLTGILGFFLANFNFFVAIIFIITLLLMARGG